jgi:hypothetical protein
MRPGKAWRIPNYDEIGMPTIVQVSPEVAARVKWLRYQWFDVECSMWIDELSGEVYGQPKRRALGFQLHGLPIQRSR